MSHPTLAWIALVPLPATVVVAIPARLGSIGPFLLSPLGVWQALLQADGREAKAPGDSAEGGRRATARTPGMPSSCLLSAS
jgi:hypothetical protein